MCVYIYIYLFIYIYIFIYLYTRTRACTYCVLTAGSWLLAVAVFPVYKQCRLKTIDIMHTVVRLDVPTSARHSDGISPMPGHSIECAVPWFQMFVFV